MRIIKAEKDIGALEKRLWEGFWNTHNKNMGYKKLKFIIEEDGVDIGYIHVIISGGVMRVEDLIIDSEYRGKHIGHEIMEFIDRLARENNCHKIRLETCPDFMPIAYHLYQKHGYRKEAKLKNDLHNREWIIMSKQMPEQ